MVLENERGTLREGIEKMQLRAGDIGEIKGKFEIHFLGKNVELPKDFHLTHDVWNKWYGEANRIAADENLSPCRTSQTLDESFQNYFKVTLPPDRHITPELCHSWRDTHHGILIRKLLERLPGPRGIRKTDSS